ncbi:MAG: hypothetical protein IH619_00050 [Ignavibacterium sp.]|nr:hypothetical protein [Ignavibacterium sp.]
MKNTILGLLLLVIVSGYSSQIIAQCSDAGVCSVGHTMGDNNDNILDVNVGYKFGSSGKEDDVKYHSLQLGAIYNIFEKTSLQLSIPYNIQSGPLGDVNGIGDLLVSISQNIISDNNSSLNASIGAKFATGKDNVENLPMAYQSGLGSNDILFALNYSYNNIGFGIGYQIAGGRNKNVIKLERGDDLLLRASYNFLLDQITIQPQILFIKRLSKSNVVNSASMAPMETYIDVENSDQSQLNLLTVIQHKINKSYSLFADFAIPFIKREVNVDGLTRSFSASIGVQLNFN